jgi:metallo-beta-lactamase family protein
MKRRTTAKATGLTVTFWGAAHTVTGSMHLVETGGKKLLLDCGLYQGRRAEARERNCCFPFAPKAIDAVILSHAHMDHCGNLPNLVRQGFAGPIWCTPATRDLAAIMLADGVKIQEEDAIYLNRKRDKGEPRVEPLYSRKDVHQTVRCFQSLAYDRPQEILRGLEVRLVDAGHLLGSAMVSLHIAGKGSKELRLTFTGDLGRRGLPILRDPAPVPPADLLLSESTYGGRVHPPVESLADGLGEVVRRTADRGGKVLIPAFSLGRTQTVVYYLHQLMSNRQLPPLPIFVDSPLAARATEIFRLHPECFDEQTAELLEDDPDLFGGGRIQYIHSVEESKALNGRTDPCVIIAASGMCESGRILHHLKHNIADERNTIMIVGYQAPETLGWRLVKRQPEVRILDRRFPLKAEVVVKNEFSSHADRNDLLAFLGPLAPEVHAVRLVHGDPEQSEALAQELRGHGFRDVAVPERGQSVHLD